MTDRTAAALRAVARAAPDARGHFPAMYARVTERVGAAVRQGRFADGPALEAFVDVFAALYLRAVDDPGRPRCWQAAHDAAADRRHLVVQHLLLGINAHVNHDLALAVVDAAGDRDLAHVRPDFDAVNDVLAEAYVDVLRDLRRPSRWAALAAARGGGTLFHFSLREARRQAWHSAEQLHRLRPGRERDRYRVGLDGAVTALARLVTRPPAPARPLLALARATEDRDPRRVTRSLLGER